MACVYIMRVLEPTITGITDTFDRADGTSVLANRSDGGLWTVGDLSDMEIDTNRLVRTAGGISTVRRQWLWADYGYSSTVTVQFDFARTDFSSLYAYIAKESGGAQGYEVQFYPFDGGYVIIKNAADSIIVNQYTGNGWTDGVSRTVVITFDYSSGAITVSVGGTSFVSYTDTGTLPTATGLAMFPGSAGMYVDNVHVTGT